MREAEDLTPQLDLLWRLLTYSAMTQIGLTVRGSSAFLEAGPQKVELYLDDRNFDRPRAILIPESANRLSTDIARVFLPPWMAEVRYYPLLEKYLNVLFRIDSVIERHMPVILLPASLYQELAKHKRLSLTSSWKRARGKASVVYQFEIHYGIATLKLLNHGSRFIEVGVHVEPREARQA